MKITGVSTVVYRQQLKPRAPKLKFAGEPRTTFETLLVKVETDGGLTGWGEAFPHRVWRAVKSLVETLIAPACIGADPTDISALMNRLMRQPCRSTNGSAARSVTGFPPTRACSSTAIPTWSRASPRRRWAAGIKTSK